MRAPSYSKNVNEIFSPEFINDPFPLYAHLRAQKPISEIGDSGFFLVTTWELIKEVLKREDDFSANLIGVLCKTSEGIPGSFDFPDTGATSVIATADGKDHSRHRNILSPAFTHHALAKFESYIREIAEEDLYILLRDRGGSCIPFIEKIPALAIAKLLGLPCNESDQFIRWAMIGGSMLAGEVSVRQLEYLARETEVMKSYLSMHFDKSYRLDWTLSEPLLTLLHREYDEGTITRDEAIGISVILFGAGGESTSALMGSCIFHLARSPEIQEELRSNFQLIDNFIEEVIRLSPPFKFHYRSVRSSCAIGNYDLSPGQKLMLCWDSANRDGIIFEDAERFSLSRKRPKSHMGFGRGSHFCLGAVLARLEVKVVIEELINRTSNIRLHGAPNYFDSIFVRRFNSLAISIEI